MVCLGASRWFYICVSAACLTDAVDRSAQQKGNNEEMCTVKDNPRIVGR